MPFYFVWVRDIILVTVYWGWLLLSFALQWVAVFCLCFYVFVNTLGFYLTAVLLQLDPKGLSLAIASAGYWIRNWSDITTPIVLLLILFLVGATLFKHKQSLCRFRLDEDKMSQDCYSWQPWCLSADCLLAWRAHVTLLAALVTWH